MSDSTDTPNDSSLVVEEITTNDSPSDIAQFKPEIPDTGFLPLQDFMGLAHPDDEQKEKLSFIWNEVGKGRSREETLEAIKNIRYSLSAPDVGENYLHKLYSYVRLMADGRAIEREKKVYESDHKLDNPRP